MTSLAPVRVLGAGAVTPIGRDLSDIARQLDQPVMGSNARRVDADLLADPAIAKKLRRADRLIRMATLAATDAWNAALRDVPADRVGLILATGLGPHVRGFKFLDGLLDCGDLAALPTDFSHSVHNAAAAYIAQMLELRGPTLTVTDFQIGFEQAVVLAQTWLAEGACDRVLVGAAEEIGDVLLHCARRMAGQLTPGEGAVFFHVARSSAPYPIAHPNTDETSLPQKALYLDAVAQPGAVDWLLGEFPSVAPLAAKRQAAFFPHFGDMATGVAFQLLAAYCAMTRTKNPVDNAATFRRISASRDATLSLSKETSG